MNRESKTYLPFYNGSDLNRIMRTSIRPIPTAHETTQSINQWIVDQQEELRSQQQ